MSVNVDLFQQKSQVWIKTVSGHLHHPQCILFIENAGYCCFVSAPLRFLHSQLHSMSERGCSQLFLGAGVHRPQRVKEWTNINKLKAKNTLIGLEISLTDIQQFKTIIRTIICFYKCIFFHYMT